MHGICIVVMLLLGFVILAPSASGNCGLKLLFFAAAFGLRAQISLVFCIYTLELLIEILMQSLNLSRNVFLVSATY